MEIIISNNANKPIYEQITSQIKAMIMSEELTAGDSLPFNESFGKVASCKCNHSSKGVMKIYSVMVLLKLQ